MSWVDKVNVLHSMSVFRGVFVEVATRHADIGTDTDTDTDTDYAYVDAVPFNIQKWFWKYDALVMD